MPVFMRMPNVKYLGPWELLRSRQNLFFPTKAQIAREVIHAPVRSMDLTPSPRGTAGGSLPSYVAAFTARGVSGFAAPLGYLGEAGQYPIFGDFGFSERWSHDDFFSSSTSGWRKDVSARCKAKRIPCYAGPPRQSDINRAEKVWSALKDSASKGSEKAQQIIDDFTSEITPLINKIDALTREHSFGGRSDSTEAQRIGAMNALLVILPRVALQTEVPAPPAPKPLPGDTSAPDTGAITSPGGGYGSNAGASSSGGITRGGSASTAGGGAAAFSWTPVLLGGGLLIGGGILIWALARK